MALSNQDRVLEASTTTGTGTYTLGGSPAITGFSANDYDTFASVGNANTCIYTAVGVDPATGIPNNTGWEVGLGTYTASGTTLARTTIYRSTNANAAVNWSAGTRFIFCSPVTEGTVVVRQPGGTVGTDQVEISHSGSVTTIESKDGGIDLRVPYSTAIKLGRVDAASVEVYQILVSGAIYNQDYATFGLIEAVGIKVKRGKHFGFTAAETYNTTDICFVSPAPAVISLSTDGSAAGGWLQNTGAMSRVNANVTNTTTTMAHITGLSSSVITTRKYTGKLVLYVSEATAADGIKIDFDAGNATMTSFRAHATIFDTALLLSSQTSALATDFVVATITGDSMVEINFSFVCDATGTFRPRFAKNSDAAGATLTCYLGSFMCLEDMP